MSKRYNLISHSKAYQENKIENKIDLKNNNKIVEYNKMTAIYHPNINLKKHNDYMTPRYAWENIKEYLLPYKDKVAWECFYGNGESGEHLKAIGLKNVIHNPYPEYDFFKYEPEHYDIIITNPPFQYSKEVLTRLKKLGKPFCLILPCAKLTTQYFKDLFAEDDRRIQIIIPRKRIHFKKIVNGKQETDGTGGCCFDCFYYTWQMNLKRDIIHNATAVEMKKKGNHKSNRKKTN